MRSGRLLILAVVVLALGAYIFFFERHQPTTEEVRQQADKVLPDLKRDQIAALEIRSSHGLVKIVKTPEKQWKLVKPIEYPADESAVRSLVTGLVDLKINRSLKPGEVKPAEYGLDKPKLSVVVETKDGARRELKLGSKAALGADRAVSVGDGRILLCSDTLSGDLEKGLDGWRSHRVVELFPDQLASVEITAGKDHIQAVRDGQLWKLLQPVKDLADRDHIRNLVSGLNTLKVEQFLDSSADLHELGLDKPRYRVVLVRSKGAKPVELDFGRLDKTNGATRVACRRGGKDLFWVNDRAENALGLAPVLWRSQKVYPFESWNVQAATFTRGKESVSVERKEGVWKVAGGAAANGSEVLSRLGKLSELRAIDFDLIASGPKEMGRVALKIGSDAGVSAKKAQPAKVTFTFFEPLSPHGRALVRVDARATTMSVEAAKAREILADLGALKAKPKPTPAAKEKT